MLNFNPQSSKYLDENNDPNGMSSFHTSVMSNQTIDSKDQ